MSGGQSRSSIVYLVNISIALCARYAYVIMRMAYRRAWRLHKNTRLDNMLKHLEILTMSGRCLLSVAENVAKDNNVIVTDDRLRKRILRILNGGEGNGKPPRLTNIS